MVEGLVHDSSAPTREAVEPGPLDWNEPGTDSMPLVVLKARTAFGDDAFTFQVSATQIVKNPFALSKTVPLILIGLVVVSARSGPHYRLRDLSDLILAHAPGSSRS